MLRVIALLSVGGLVAITAIPDSFVSFFIGEYGPIGIAVLFLYREQRSVKREVKELREEIQ